MLRVLEEVCRVGDSLPLHGVVSTGQEAVPGMPIVVLLNSGIIHKTGACRLSVKVARSLAAQGITSARFDLSGIGDSPYRVQQNSPEDSDLADCCEFLNYLEERYDCSNFILMGLCSGAFIALETACRDSRIRGVIQIDGYTYDTPGQKITKTLYSILRSLCLPRRKRSEVADFSASSEAVVHSTWEQRPDKAAMEAKLLTVREKGVQLYSFFTSLETTQVGQFEKVFSKTVEPGWFRSLYLLDALHILPDPRDQELVIESVCSWVIEKFGKPLPGMPVHGTSPLLINDPPTT